MEKDFLQSEEWRKFQEAVGRKTYVISDSPSPPTPLPPAGEGGVKFSASIIEHRLPIVGSYFYVPRWPSARISNFEFRISNQHSKLKIQNLFSELINLAKKNNIGWIRIDPETEEILNAMKKDVGKSLKLVRSPHDMQPKEVFVIDIAKPEEQLLAEMKSKTRYNIRLAEKKGISLRITNNFGTNVRITNNKDIEEFIRLTNVMARRQRIVTHPDGYYRKMFETVPGDILKLYIAEYKSQVIAANLVAFYGKTCTYLHGASDDKYKNLMAPYLLQWRQIQDAKKAGCARYDFGGIKTLPHPSPLLIKEREQKPSPLQGEGARRADEVSSWAGITRFKTGFSPDTRPEEFPGSYDIVISRKKYFLYRFLQKIKSFIK